MYEFNYHRPASLAEAQSQLAGAVDGVFLAGGQTLLPTMKQRLAAPSDLIDLSKIDELKGIEVNGKSVKIGAMTTHAEVAAHDGLRKVCHAIAEMGGWIGDPHVRAGVVAGFSEAPWTIVDTINFGGRSTGKWT